MNTLRIWRIPYSTNVERVALACAHKQVAVTWVDADPADRSALRALSGQDLVPVLEAGDGSVVADSTAILAWLEERVPEPALWPSGPTRRAETDIAIEWFNRVWKLPPNTIDTELGRPDPDPARIAAWAAQMTGWLPWFEDLLAERPFLLGETLGAADLCAFPFLKYGALPLAADDGEVFHAVLAEHLALGGGYPELRAWIARIDALPRA